MQIQQSRKAEIERDQDSSSSLLMELDSQTAPSIRTIDSSQGLEWHTVILLVTRTLNGEEDEMVRQTETVRDIHSVYSQIVRGTLQYFLIPFQYSHFVCSTSMTFF